MNKYSAILQNLYQMIIVYEFILIKLNVYEQNIRFRFWY